MLKELIRTRLIAAADEIFELFERTMASYEEELSRTREEKARHGQQLEDVYKTHIVIQSEGDQQPPHIKEEAKDLWTNQQGEGLLEAEEEDLGKLPLTVVSVKAEDDEDEPQADDLFSPLADSDETSHSHGEDDGREPLSSDTDCEGDLRTHTGMELSDCPEKKSGMECFACSFCAKSFSDKTAVTRHMRTHTGERPFSCSVCAKTFSRKFHMLSHMRTHTGEKPYRCSICGKGFNHKGNMESHMRLHTGEKPFPCPICDETFIRKVSLIVHQRTHTGEKPFGCSVCGKQFSHKSYMVKHMRTHTGEKPFICTVCGKGLAVKASLIRHQRTHVGEKS
ncbi:gastrula zinc finger protein XlCGF8.2DB-like isoform X1 [Entelurus aequoreus]|uniref:gastrula zinc finger protein XlCGF8.2DB-like isoform X1 n=1 Tax=Entelurus aequoreus TaxID=161455 RepID=UPI002B1D6116|nr:gastrula zinc finger protein XlCGF8.2DB-like isoform X1 [Entelurus aequoreus]